MQVYQLYSTTEIAALFLSIVVGTIGYLGVVWKTNPKEVTIRYILAILSINTTFVWIASEFLRATSFGAYRTAVLPAVAFAGQWMADFLRLKYPQLFGALLGKVGIDVGETKDNVEPVKEDKK